MEDNANTTRNNIIVRSTEEIIGLATFTITIIVLAVPANTLVLLGYLTSTSARRKHSNYLLVNMTVSELVTALTVIPLQLATGILEPSLVVDGGALCKLVGFTNYPFYIVSEATMVCISVDRLYAIRYPLVYRTKVTGKWVFGMIAYTWIHAVTFVLVFGFVAGFKHNNISVECGIVWAELPFSVSLLTATTHIALPFALLIAFNWNLVLCLRRQNRTLEVLLDPQLEVVSDSRNRGNKSRQAQERRVACMVLWIITSYLICWSPYLVTRSLHITSLTISPLFDAVATLILHCSVVINPVLNLIFRKELRLTLGKLFKRRNVFPRTQNGGHTSRVIGTTASPMVMRITSRIQP